LWGRRGSVETGRCRGSRLTRGPPLKGLMLGGSSEADVGVVGGRCRGRRRCVGGAVRGPGVIAHTPRICERGGALEVRWRRVVRGTTGRDLNTTDPMRDVGGRGLAEGVCKNKPSFIRKCKSM
jgi:hypothetical protein